MSHQMTHVNTRIQRVMSMRIGMVVQIVMIMRIGMVVQIVMSRRKHTKSNMYKSQAS